jgi:O-antigen/teichoic acid export membrane protein
MSVILARALGPEGRGEWALILLNIVLMTLIINFGTPEASIYFIGQKKYKEQDIFFSLIAYSMVVAQLVSLLSILLYYFNMNYLFYNMKPNIFYTALLVIIIQVVNTQIRHFLLGKKDVRAYNLVLNYEAIILLIVVVVGTALKIMSVSALLYLYLFTNVISLYLHIIKVNKFVRWAHFFSSIKFIIIKDCIKKGFAYFFTGMGGFWNHRSNFLFLQFFHTTKDVGMYTIALAIPNLIANIPSQISLILYPYISALKDNQTAINLTSVIVKISTLISLLLYIPIIIWGSEIITFIYGEQYKGLNLSLNILFAAMIFDGIVSLLFNHFGGKGKPIYGIYMSIISITVIVMTGFLLVPQFGVSGTAMVRLIAAFCASIFFIYLFVRQNGIINTFLIRSRDIRIFKQIINQKI